LGEGREVNRCVEANGDDQPRSQGVRGYNKSILEGR
jgi:hypothetical protein